MPIVRETTEEIKSREKLERESKEAYYRDREKERSKEVAIAKHPTKTRKRDMFFNAPARFIGIIIVYKLLKNGKEVPSFLSDFIGRR